MIEINFKLKNYKTIKNIGISIEKIYPVNVIIGKNNIGKSSFLDALDAICGNDKQALKDGELEITEMLNDKTVYMQMARDRQTGNYVNDNEDREKLIDASITWLEKGNERQYKKSGIEHIDSQNNFINKAIRLIKLPTTKNLHIRLAAERDILPELSEGSIELSSKGAGASRIINSLLHDSLNDHRIVDRDILSALNEIFTGDIRFCGITTKQDANTSLWEIYLAEKEHDYYALSQSGSGLKTVILVLLNLIARPAIDKMPLSKYIFSFEELENNLHPTLQRNLFLFLERFAVNNDCHIFLTTHSHIAIDVFCNSQNAQICHVHKFGNETAGQVFSNTTHGYRILDDLGVRASDILQSNGIIWIEGPSDRIFLNKFIELWSAGSLREGAHYQFAFYGGSVLSNFDVSIPQERFEDALKVFRINKNAIFICDGDKKKTGDGLKDRVRMLSEKLDNEQGLLWVTNAREIENYIPKEAFEMVHSKAFTTQIGELTYIQDFLNEQTGSKATEYREKVRKATDYSAHFTLENLEFRPELDEKMKEMCAKISLWNHL